MKIRNGYVSNSSSSSFIIYDWFDLSEEKRQFVKNYRENVLKLWKEKNVPVIEDGDGFFHVETEQLDFGWIANNEWFFEEYINENICTVWTVIDNFDMAKWLHYNNVKFDEDFDF